MNFISLAFVSLFVACSGPERGEAEFRPTAEEDRVPELFRLEADRYEYELEPLRTTPKYKVSALRFPSPIPSPDPVNNTVHAEYFQPEEDEGKRPAVVVLHILGADFALSRFIAARLADNGVAALFVKLPYYGERRPEASARFLSADIDRSVLAMRQGVCDIRRAVAWLADRPEVDSEALGITGISLGGIVGAVASAADPRLKNAALLLAGGGLADILWDMPEREARFYKQQWIDSGRTKDDLKTLTQPFDPLTYADRLRGKRVLMIAGNTDEVIPPSATESLWEAAGRPTIHWYDCGHYSAAGYLLPALREVVAFFSGGRSD
ncbi:hypothetical protein BH23PLA1_BH23PLA1_19730 [soil metagenome]